MESREQKTERETEAVQEHMLYRMVFLSEGGSESLQSPRLGEGNGEGTCHDEMINLS